MDKTIMISKIVLLMREYQKQNNIKNNCSTNTQYLYDCIKQNFINANVKACAVIVISTENDITTCVAGHLVILLDNTIIIDPSYDVYKKINKSYCNNVKDFIELYSGGMEKLFIKEVCTKYIYFMSLADSINKGKILINDKTYYNEQADYIEESIKVIQ